MIAKIALCAFLSVAILTTGVSAQSALPDGATLAWAENFDALESARWSHGLAWGLDYDSGLQRYRPENVTVENGALTIRAKPQASGDPARRLAAADAYEIDEPGDGQGDEDREPGCEEWCQEIREEGDGEWRGHADGFE